jgi:coproporphyrinogen III oxidase
MAHGGTNFGFRSGANTNPDGSLAPATTRYDYDRPLSEAGDATPKCEALKAVLARHGAATSTVLHPRSPKLPAMV